MNPLLSVVFYVGLYRIYVEFLNRKGLKTGFKRKGGWVKSLTFPYWDNWAWTHLAWGALGGVMGLNLATMATLSVLNEFMYEHSRCQRYSEGDKSIYYAQYCDPFGHKVADATYTLVGYAMFKALHPPNRGVF